MTLYLLTDWLCGNYADSKIATKAIPNMKDLEILLLRYKKENYTLINQIY